MDIDEVIKLGQKASEGSYQFSDFTWWWIVLGVVLFLTFILGIIFMSVDAIMFGLFVGVLYFFSSFLYLNAQYHERVETNVQKWKQEVAYKYIENIPKENKEVVYIKIDPELSHEIKGSWYIHSNPVQLTPLTVSFKGNGIETITNWYETHMELTKEDKPYIEYQRLTKSLGHGIEAGIYNAKVYLPESYEFTDIK